MADDKEKPKAKGGCLKIFLWFGGGFVVLISALLFYFQIDFKNKVNDCNNGSDKTCKTLLEWYPDRLRNNEEDRELVTNPSFAPLYEKYKAEWDAEQAKIREKEAEEIKALEIKQAKERAEKKKALEFEEAVKRVKLKEAKSNKDFFVTKEMFGDKWPFTVDEGAVFCKGNSIWFGHKGKFYALNGTAKAQFGYPFPDAIWKANPNPEMAKYGLKIPTTAIDEQARKQCK